MDITNDMIKKARTAANAQELLELAKAEGIDLDAGEAEKAFSFLHEGGEELTDDALEAVAGGKGSSKPKPKYKPGQKLWKYWNMTCTCTCYVVISSELVNGKLFRYSCHEYATTVSRSGEHGPYEYRGIRTDFLEIWDLQTKDPFPNDPFIV